MRGWIRTNIIQKARASPRNLIVSYHATPHHSLHPSYPPTQRFSTMNHPQHPAFSRNLFPWVGSKRRLAKEIIARLPAHKCYCEPFAGSAAVFFRKPPSGVEILNDVCGDIVNFFRVIQRHLPEFLRMFDYTIAARQEFNRLRATPPEVLTDIERAARFYYLQKCGFGGKYASPSFGVATMPDTRAPTLQRDKMRQDLTAACARLENVQVENLPWQECLARYDRAHTLFFMDPPYFQQTGYGVAFGAEEYTQLAHAMRTMQGKAALTINDCPEMRAVFDGLHVTELRSQYSISRNRTGKTQRTELLITNY